MKTPKRIAAFAILLATASASSSFAQTDVFLVAKEFTQTMPDGVQIVMWGYALDADGDLLTDDGEAASSPGPQIVVPPGEALLRIHIRNDLPADTSLIIPGQTTTLSPVMFTDASGRERVSSFTTVVAPGATATYTWNDVRNGSFMYQSGTHVAVQIQMGLFGSMTKEFEPGRAYRQPTPFHVGEASVFYSEIDPDLHAAVAGGTYGTPAYPNTLDYRPRYFLVNGEPFSAGVADISLGAVGESSLVRFFNAGLETHVPTALGMDMLIVAEDGNLLPTNRSSYSVFLPAGKTKDVLIQPEMPGRHALVDRSMALSNNNGPDGGMLVFLSADIPQELSEAQNKLDTWSKRVFKAKAKLTIAFAMPEATPAEQRAKARAVETWRSRLETARSRLSRAMNRLVQMQEDLDS
ncbi:MAG: hypothetical protein CMJ89_09880 [Planctomycetes bacterium]|jgi:FtsP/CotA-like multicopper oxidase with cupredoxin domain|nr:hypothetical protein [Planctomycetota bacterium]